MSVIRITSMKNETRQAKNTGKDYTVLVVKGTKYSSDEPWEQPIFTNNKKILNQVTSFGVGDVANFKYEKNGKFWDLVSVVEPDSALIQKLDSGEMLESKDTRGQKNPIFTGALGEYNGKMSKAEWAAKDAKKEASIARAVALKLAVENTKVGTKAETIVEHALEFIPYLMGAFDLPKDDTADPLTPPVEG